MYATPCRLCSVRSSWDQRSAGVPADQSRRFSIQGSCNFARDLKLVHAGKGKAGEVVIVQTALENRGETDQEGLSILAPRQNAGPRRNTWPSSKDLKLHNERPGMWGRTR